MKRTNLNLPFLLALSTILMTAACDGKTNVESPKADSSTAIDLTTTSTGEVYFVSMVKLIANPEKYQGKRVMVEGYLNLEFEGNGLYLHKEDYNNGISKNAVWVDINKGIAEKAQKCKLNYVIIEATFDGKQTGHMGAYSGTLTNVTRVDVTPVRK